MASPQLGVSPSHNYIHITETRLCRSSYGNLHHCGLFRSSNPTHSAQLRFDCYLYLLEPIQVILMGLDMSPTSSALTSPFPLVMSQYIRNIKGFVFPSLVRRVQPKEKTVIFKEILVYLKNLFPSRFKPISTPLFLLSFTKFSLKNSTLSSCSCWVVINA